MKQSGLREAMPLWVWLTLGLLILGAVVYFTGYLLVEDILRLFSFALDCINLIVFVQTSTLKSEGPPY